MFKLRAWQSFCTTSLQKDNYNVPQYAPAPRGTKAIGSVQRQMLRNTALMHLKHCGCSLWASAADRTASSVSS